MNRNDIPTSTDLFSRIVDTIAGQGIVRSAVITPQSSFADWQYKPVDLRELRCLLETEFGVAIPDETLLGWQGPPDVLAYLSRPGCVA